MKFAKAALAAFAVVAGAVGGASITSATAQTSSQGVVVIDMNRLRAQSTAFQDMNQKLRKMAEDQSTAFKTANQAEITQIETQARSLRPSLQGKSQQDIAANPQLKSQVEAQVQREQAFAKKEQLFQLSLQVTGACAEANLAKALDPIIDQLMTQYNASVVLSRDVVAKARPTVDITNEALNRFNNATKTANVVWKPVTSETQNPSC